MERKAALNCNMNCRH